MAIDLTVQYPGKVDAASPQYPFGAPRNIITPGDGTGTPWEAAIVKDTEAFKQALLTAGVIVPSGTPDSVTASQIMQGLVEQCAGRATRFDSGGTANAYILTPKAGQYAPASLFAGLTVEFPSLGINTTPVTINYAGLGVANLVDPDGVALKTAQIWRSKTLRATYDGTQWLLHLNRSTDQGPFILNVPTQMAGGTTGGAIGWTGLIDPLLASVEADRAFIELRLQVSVSPGNTTILKVARGGTGPSFTTTNPASSSVVTSPTVDTGSNTNTATVNLDANYQVDYELAVAGTPGTATWSLWLMGYYTKWNERDF